MKKIILYIFILFPSLLFAQTTDYFPEFMVQKPFHGMKGKVKSYTTSTLNGKLGFRSDTIFDYVPKNIDTYFFNREGQIDSSYTVFPSSNFMSKAYYKSYVPTKSVDLHLSLDADTIIKAITKYVYIWPDKSTVLTKKIKVERKTNKSELRYDTTRIDYLNQSVESYISGEYTMTMFYEDFRLIKSISKYDNGTVIKTEYLYESDLLKAIRHYVDDKEYPEEKFIYTKFDKYGNWIESYRMTDNINKFIKSERLIIYW